MKQIELQIVEGLIVDAFLYQEMNNIAISQGRVVKVSLIEDNLYKLEEVVCDIVTQSRM